jgi:hypothetical protein
MEFHSLDLERKNRVPPDRHKLDNSPHAPPSADSSNHAVRLGAAACSPPLAAAAAVAAHAPRVERAADAADQDTSPSSTPPTQTQVANKKKTPYDTTPLIN